jgi:DNA helicase-2/ATP-dependent DNA helicase PcrA
MDPYNAGMSKDIQADPLAGLNAEQRRAAEHPSGPLLVIAGAGTGKTKTLAARVAALLARGVAPGRILLLTFTRRAAQEMIRRAGHVVGSAHAAGVWSGTFHAVANRLLRMHSQGLGLNENFTVLDQGDAEDLFHLIRTEFDLHKTNTRFPQKGTLLAIYSRCVNAGEPIEQVVHERYPWCQGWEAELKRLFGEYTRRKADRNLLDYDDLLLYWDQALATPGVGPALAARFQHILVDEYQDTNPIPASLLHKLWREGGGAAGGARSIMVVGDDAQSIYSFRGATVENILRFPEQFADAAVVTLEQNYRSTTPILESTNAVMAQAQRRFVKNLWSERQSVVRPQLVTCGDEMAQCKFVIERMLAHREEGVSLMKQAVLFRASQNSDALEVELTRSNIPFVKWGGLKFLEGAHIKDFLAYLRILENPRDELAWMRVLQLLDGVGPGRARQAVSHLQEQQYQARALTSWDAPPPARQPLEGLITLLGELSGESELPLAAQMERIRRYYAPVIEKRYEAPASRQRDLDQLELLAQRSSDRGVFLADLILDPPVSTGDLCGPPHLDEEFTVLSTIHSAKGCEWDVVYVIHAADGVLPSDMCVGEAELEEERRLLYVAMTRARDRLYVAFPLRYYHKKHAMGDAYSTAQLTRFLPPELFEHFERTGYGMPETLAARPESVPPVGESVRSRLQKLWE